MSPSESIRASEFWGKELMCADFQCVQWLLCIVLGCGRPPAVGRQGYTPLVMLEERDYPPPRKAGWTEGQLICFWRRKRLL